MEHVNAVWSLPPSEMSMVVLVVSAVKAREKYCSVVVTAKVVVLEAMVLLPLAVTFSEPAVVATAAKVTVIGVPPSYP